MGFRVRQTWFWILASRLSPESLRRVCVFEPKHWALIQILVIIWTFDADLLPRTVLSSLLLLFLKDNVSINWVKKNMVLTVPFLRCHYDFQVTSGEGFKLLFLFFSFFFSENEIDNFSALYLGDSEALYSARVPFSGGWSYGGGFRKKSLSLLLWNGWGPEVLWLCNYTLLYFTSMIELFLWKPALNLWVSERCNWEGVQRSGCSPFPGRVGLLGKSHLSSVLRDEAFGQDF